MSWHLKNKLKRTLSHEKGAVIKDWGGKSSVALVYPNTYRLGMGNLAVHSIYNMFNARPDIVCERIFLPERTALAEYSRTNTPLLSIESQRPLYDFDFAAFSISFENDYLNLLPIFDLSKLSHRSLERLGGPVIIAGGAAVTLNPMPVSAIFDAVIRGEAESYADDLLSIMIKKRPKNESIEQISQLATEIRHIDNLDAWPTETTIHCNDAEFSDMHLIEIQRGCPYRCNFCAVPAIYGPTRQRSAAAILKMVDHGMLFTTKTGLIGTHVLSHPDFIQIAQGILERGGTFSPSSIRINDIDETRAGLLARSGHKSIALGIEAASEKLRKDLNKPIANENILRTTRILARHGILKLRLYFMIGLPNEEDKDIEEIACLAKKISTEIIKDAPQNPRSTGVNITVSHFVPKKGTVFENKKFAGKEILKRKIMMLQSLLAGERSIKLRYDSVKDAVVEAYLSSAGSDAVEFLEEEYSETKRRF